MITSQVLLHCLWHISFPCLWSEQFKKFIMGEKNDGMCLCLRPDDAPVAGFGTRWVCDVKAICIPRSRPMPCDLETRLCFVFINKEHGTEGLLCYIQPVWDQLTEGVLKTIVHMLHSYDVLSQNQHQPNRLAAIVQSRSSVDYTTTRIDPACITVGLGSAGILIKC